MTAILLGKSWFGIEGMVLVIYLISYDIFCLDV